MLALKRGKKRERHSERERNELLNLRDKSIPFKVNLEVNCSTYAVLFVYIDLLVVILAALSATWGLGALLEF